MKRIIITLLISMFFLTACARADAATAIATPLPEETPILVTPVIEGAFVNECKNCHIDKQRLIDTAMPEVVVEKESTGAG